MRATIKDIAKITGFSVTTISLVLNNKADKIPQTTKDIIIQTAKKIKYRPNQIAVGLVKRQTKTLGLIIADIRNVYFANLARGVEDECRKNGWNLILCNTNNKHEREKEYIQVLAAKGVDGLLVVLSADSDEACVKENIEIMEKLNIPYIFLDRYIKGVECPIIRMDNIEGGYLATRHLLELGHRKIACITGPADLSDSDERLQGYKKAIAKAGIPYEETIIYEGSYTWEDGVEAVNYWMENKMDFTAIFAFNDLSAYGVCKQLKKFSLSTPKDISVIGYDNIFFSEVLETPLTTINQPIYEMGLYAAEQLLDVIKNKKSITQFKIFEPELVIRESTCKNKKKEEKEINR